MPTLKEQFWDPVAGFGVTFRTMFKKVVTEQYPFEKVPTAPRFHGRHQLNRWPDGLEKCIGCELCAWACPADAIYVEGASNTEDERFSPGERYGRVYQINYLRCILCGLCIEACPTRALTMTNEYELADDNRADLIYTKNDLLAPLLPGMEQPPHPMRLGDDEGDYYRGTYKTKARAGAGDRARDGGGPVIAFYILAPIMVLAALGILFVRKAVHAALLLAVVMISLAILYAALEAPFLFAVQIIVYTGAILMLFLFVLMLVGVDASDSVVETIRGQRLFAILGGLILGVTLVVGVGQLSLGSVVGLSEVNKDGNIEALANILFSRYVFAFEVTSALLITAAVGAMVLAHRERLTPKSTQAQLAAERVRSYAETGLHLGPLPPPGVFARHNAVGTPALLPDGSVAEASLSRVLEARGTVRPAPRDVEAVQRSVDYAPDGAPHSEDRRTVARPAPPAARAPARDPTPRRKVVSDGQRDAVHRALRDPVHHRLGRGAHPAQRHRGVHVRGADAQRQQPRPGRLRQAARQPRRPGRGVLRDGGRRGRGRGRPRDHHDDLPHPPLGLGRRRQPAQVLTRTGHRH